jgi:GH25 family lysozyme M1 (1,4-beta-N-acetylmuramidase)
MSWVRGIDVSQFQGRRLPWTELKAMGIEFAYVRCHHGNDHAPDPVFGENVRAARGAGVRVGAYCVPFPLPHLRPADQVALWQDSLTVDGDRVGSLIGELPVAIDIEWPPPHEWPKWKCDATQITEWALDCLALWDNRPIVYSYPFFIQALAASRQSVELAKYELWIAGGPQYQNGNGRLPGSSEAPPRTAIWTDRWKIWQYDGDGGARMPNGIDADFNVFNGTIEDLDTFCGRVPVSLESDRPPPSPDSMRSLLLDFEIRDYRKRREM